MSCRLKDRTINAGFGEPIHNYPSAIFVAECDTFTLLIAFILRYKYSRCNFMNDQISQHKPNGLILGYRYLPFFSR